jgi:hypothetical protein
MAENSGASKLNSEQSMQDDLKYMIMIKESQLRKESAAPS